MAIAKLFKAIGKKQGKFLAEEKQRLKKKPSNIKESADKAKHHRSAAVKALTRQQQKIKELAMEEGVSVKKYKEKFSDSPPMKKLRELEKQNQTIKEKKFLEGGLATKKYMNPVTIVDNRKNK